MSAAWNWDSASGVTVLDNELLELSLEIGMEADQKYMPCLSEETWHWVGKMGEPCMEDTSSQNVGVGNCAYWHLYSDRQYQFCRISGSHSDGCEEIYLLGYNVVLSVRSQPTCFMLVSCMAYSLALKMVATYYFEMSVNFQRATRHNKLILYETWNQQLQTWRWCEVLGSGRTFIHIWGAHVYRDNMFFRKKSK
jgi:hypothetical protein